MYTERWLQYALDLLISRFIVQRPNTKPCKNVSVPETEDVWSSSGSSVWHVSEFIVQARKLKSSVDCTITQTKHADKRPPLPRQNWPFATGDLDPHLIHAYLGPPDSTTQTTSRLVQPFLQGSRSWQIDRQTDRPRYIGNSRPHLRTPGDSTPRRLHGLHCPHATVLTTSAFWLGRTRKSSPQRCYLNCHHAALVTMHTQNDTAIKPHSC